MKLIKRKENIIFVVLILLTLPAIIPFLKSGFIVTDDGGWMVIRLSAFYDTIRDGQIPARFIERLNYGYGYPVSNFLYPGYLYLGSIVHILGFNFIDSIKILFASSLILSAVFSYIWLRKLFGKVDSLLGALVYLYSPYHLFDIYKRGSLGEALSIAILPLSFYAIEKRNTLLTAFSVFLILIFHNTLAIFFLPLIPIYALLRKSFSKSLPGMILGGAMSSFFTVPAIFELRYTKFLQTPISNPSEYFADFYLVGIVSVVVFVLLGLVIYKNKLRKVTYKEILILFLLTFIFSVFLSSSLSSFIWNSIGSSFVQFPYRFLSLTIISVSFLSSYVSYVLFSKLKFALLIFILLLLVISGYRYFAEIEYSYFPDEYYSTNDATTTVHDEYMPIWVKEKPDVRPESKVEVLSGDASVSSISEISNKIEFEVDVNSDSKIRVNTIYWPGWRLFVKGEEREISYDNDYGVIEFELKQYDDKVTLSFQDDLLRTISNTISLLALLIVCYLARPFLRL